MRLSGKAADSLYTPHLCDTGLIRPSLAGFDSTTDRKVRSSRAISAQIQLVEIAKALSYDAQIVIMEQGQSISELEALDRGYSPAGGTGQ